MILCVKNCENMLGAQIRHNVLTCVPFMTKTMPGKCLVFDDSYEHEVWNRTEGERVLLLFDLWHPDLVEEVRPVCHSFECLIFMCQAGGCVTFIHQVVRAAAKNAKQDKT